MTPRFLIGRNRLAPLAALLALAIISELAYLWIAAAGQSLHIEAAGKHSLLTILALFGVAVACNLLATKIAVTAHQDRRLMALIVIGAAAFRATLLFSDPIEEIDLYRYLWDGQVTISGISPFRYSPRQILTADRETELPADLSRLAAIRDATPAMPEVLDRIHYGELPTIYPPTSQVVFALATLCTPRTASVVVRMTIMKAWFVAFDLATILPIVLLLKWVGRPQGWSIAYAWCPLLIKEVANSGHLDALALFLSAWAIYLAVVALFPRPSSAGASDRYRFVIACCAAGVFALSIGAKLYPVVLVPLFLITARQRLGWQAAIVAGCVVAACTVAVLWPMVPRDTLAELPRVRISAASDDLPPLPPTELDTTPRDPSQSLRTFLSEWEMNDFLFLFVMENVRPTKDLPADEVAWFSVVPESWREALCSFVATISGVEHGRAPFFISRAATSLVFLGLALWFAHAPGRSNDAAVFLEATFLTLAWFWLLLPTQNPWYWTWALPFAPFARGRAWLALSGLAFFYYFRFWLAHHFATSPILGTPYSGPMFFDYVVTWIEFAPWFAWLLAAWAVQRLSSSIALDPAAKNQVAVS